jgi:hypothetical protein
MVCAKVRWKGIVDWLASGVGLLHGSYHWLKGISKLNRHPAAPFKLGRSTVSVHASHGSQFGQLGDGQGCMTFNAVADATNPRLTKLS